MSLRIADVVVVIVRPKRNLFGINGVETVDQEGNVDCRYVRHAIAVEINRRRLCSERSSQVGDSRGMT